MNALPHNFASGWPVLKGCKMRPGDKSELELAEDGTQYENDICNEHEKGTTFKSCLSLNGV